MTARTEQGMTARTGRAMADEHSKAREHGEGWDRKRSARAVLYPVCWMIAAGAWAGLFPAIAQENVQHSARRTPRLSPQPSVLSPAGAEKNAFRPPTPQNPLSPPPLSATGANPFAGTPGSIVGWGSQVVGVDLTKGFVSVAAGYQHSLGLKPDGSIVAWGRNSEG